MPFIEYEESILAGQAVGNIKVTEDVLADFRKARSLMHDMVSDSSLATFSCVKRALQKHSRTLRGLDRTINLELSFLNQAEKFLSSRIEEDVLKQLPSEERR